MVDLRRGVLESIFSTADSTRSDRERICDIVLMIALADAFIGEPELAQLIRLMKSYGELEGIEQEWIVRRATELRENAPLFSEAREQLVRELTDPKARRLGLTIATKLVHSVHPIQEEQRALLLTLADAFRIPEPDRPSLFAPWSQNRTFGPDTLTYQHCRFNAPDRLVRQSIFEAMIEAEAELEFRLLTHKVSSMRNLISMSFDGAEIIALGEIIKVGPYGFRVDALIEHESDANDSSPGYQRLINTPGYQRYITRYLAPGEALHPLEHTVLAALTHRLDESAHVLIVHSQDLSPTDRVFLQGMDPNVVRGAFLEA